MNNSYDKFSEYYDIYTSFVDYELWSKYIYALADKDLTNKNILDLGCGSGEMLLSIDEMTNANLYGVDISEEMLSIADQNAFFKNKKLNLIKCDMSKFICDIKFDLIYSACDSMNYLLNEEEFIDTLNNAYEILNENSIFTFDIINKDHIETNDDFSYENIYFVIKRKKEENYLYTDIKIYEDKKEAENISHKQRLYSIDEIKKMYNKTKFDDILFYDFLTAKGIEKTSDKIQIILKKY
ncbi:class I SAM-dependent DNA methyltransferase [Anaerofustis stercorihominis]|uniref:class I SAM-dependent DNA methyltransferase n=1 Tax=Anaerofustis stercorihominis TaxID=214853 RepID=UPI00214B6B16|nr:class I SAM-dependent methyltransferase [Anaerofustis stercorihominis]MCR2032721.1 class I SAM-dependent methyltransferase [Anaerofustis stercorihominis]